MASDGVWDVFTHEEACQFVFQHLEAQAHGEQRAHRQQENVLGLGPGLGLGLGLAGALSNLLVEEALRRGSQDNATACILVLQYHMQ